MGKNQWESYSNNLINYAIKSGYANFEIVEYLKYAKVLFDRELPVIFDQIHLSLLLGYKINYLLKVSNSQEKFYRTFTIAKKAGGKRKISEPLPSLKEIQHWIMEKITSKFPVSKFAKAYIQDRSIKANASYHVNQQIVLTIDISDFFGSIKFPRIYSLFRSSGYAENVSVMLANLCSFKGQLPQGAPTSPSISNCIFLNIDKRISAFSNAKGIHYTRYADDLTFSGDFQPGMVIKFVRNVLEENGFSINEKKLRVRRPHQRQEVTGIVVNERMQVERELRRNIRQAMYYIQKYGLESHLQFINNDKLNYPRHLLGKINFILFINPEDSEFIKYKQELLKYLSQ